MSAFTAKNEARKRGRENGTRTDRTIARADRRDVNGAFGDATAADWNRLIVGTTGAPR